MATVLIVGAGDMGERLAAGLAAGGRVREIVLVDRPGADVAAAAATLATASDCRVEPVELDAEGREAVAEVIARTRPDLIVQCAARRGPWALVGRDDPAARAVSVAGLGLRLPYQLPVLLAVAGAARDAGYAGPIANLSLPDVTGPILARLGLAPTCGLGNAGMILRRVRAALLDGAPPLVRVIGHHCQVYGVMQAREPADPEDRARVYVGDEGRRDDGLAYRAPGLAPGVRYNHVTAAAAVPVLQALLPGAPPLRWSTPSPGGLPGGYPVRIEDGAVALDLPPSVDRDEAIAFNERLGRADGVERIDDDGTVHFTAACRAAVTGVAPDLAEPLRIEDLEHRAALLDAVLGVRVSRSPMTDRGHLRSYPDAAGNYGRFGGEHYPPELQPALRELARTYEAMRSTPELEAELGHARKHFQGRPTPVHFLGNLTGAVGGAALFVKREDLNHTGAHKLNHCIGFAVLARKLGKAKLIAETGAGQHGVALATAAAYFGLECEVHMGEVDVAKAHSNVSRMRILGAEVVPVAAGQGALKDASDSAYAAYAEQHRSALYAIGSAIGPHPFPLMVRDFQSIVGQEAGEQFAELTDGAPPDHVVACVAGGSNAMGIFSAFLDDPAVALHCVEPLGRSGELGEHAATLTFGSEGIIHGARCLVLQDADGAPAKVSSIASGLVYPGVGPEICMLVDTGRASVHAIDDEQALDAFFRLSRAEGIIPALESAHAIAYAIQLAARRPSSERILVNLSGRGDKDVDYVIANHGPLGPAAA